MPEQNKKVPFFKKWGVLMTLSLALAIIIIDTTVLNVSLRTIILDLRTNIQSIQWVITAYSLTLAALTITGGRLGDLFGRKRMFMLGAVIFAIGSFITSISHSVGVMITGESVIEGVGAALMMPATASLLVSHYQGRDRALAFGVWGGIAAAASAIGPILGGFLTSHYSWRWAFRINIFVAIILLFGSAVISEARDREEAPSLDWVGVLLSASGLLSIVFGVIESSIFGWFKATQPYAVLGHKLPAGLSITPVAVVAGFGLLVLFGWWEQKRTAQGRTPLVSLKIFANRQFTAGAVTTSFMSLGQVGLIFTLPIFLQSVRGLDALHTGYALLPMSLALLIAAPLSGVISKAIRPKTLVQIGLLLDVLGIIVLRQSLHVTSTILSLSPGLIIYGAGIGLVISQVSNITLSAVSVHEAGEASGVNNTFRQIGSTFGSAILGAILLSSLGSNLRTGIDNSSVIPRNQKAAIASQAVKQTSNIEFGSGLQTGNAVSPELNKELLGIGHQATVNANHTAFLYMGLFIMLSFAASTRLPKEPRLDHGESLAVKPVH